MYISGYVCHPLGVLVQAAAWCPVGRLGSSAMKRAAAGLAYPCAPAAEADPTEMHTPRSVRTEPLVLEAPSSSSLASSVQSQESPGSAYSESSAPSSSMATTPTALGFSAASSVSVDPPGRPGVFRRRLRCKTSELGEASGSLDLLDEDGVELPAMELEHAGGVNDPLDEDDAAVEDDAGRSKEVIRLFCARYRRWWLAKMVAEQNIEDGIELGRLRRRCDFRRMSSEAKLVCAKEYYRYHPDQPDKSVVLELFTTALERQKDIKKGSAKFIETKAILLTFNGPWGEVKDIQLPDSSADDICNDVAEKLQKHERIVHLWEDFRKTVDAWQDKFMIPSAAYAFELCTTTLKEKRSIRVHGHVFLRGSSAARLRIQSYSQLLFQGVAPHKADNVMGVSLRARGGGSNAGMYYLQCPKIGVIFNAGSSEPFRDYMVSGEWVLSLVQGGKMTYKDARKEIIRSAKNLPRLLQSLDRWHMETTRQSLEAYMLSVQSELDATKKPFRHIDVVADWVASHKVNAMRYKFLVLCGGSGLGKTQFAKSLVASGRTLELNMASAPEPDMREYDYNLHDLVLFDECAPQQILRQKKLFQCPAVEVGLAASATSCHAYKVWVHKKLFVVATNVWQHELARLPADDSSWLVMNSVVVEVDAPLWEK